MGGALPVAPDRPTNAGFAAPEAHEQVGVQGGPPTVSSTRVGENCEDTVAPPLRIHSLKRLLTCEVSIYKAHHTAGKSVLSSETLNPLVLFPHRFLTPSQQHRDDLSFTAAVRAAETRYQPPPCLEKFLSSPSYCSLS